MMGCRLNANSLEFLVSLGLAVGFGGCYAGVSSEPLAESEGTGEGTDGAADSAGSGGDSDTPLPPDTQCKGDAFGLGAGPMLRMTTDEYDATVRDLIGEDLGLARSFSGDDQVGAFLANGIAPPSELEIEQYMAAAVSASEAAVENLGAIVPCDPAVDGVDDCGVAFIETFGRRAFRRTLEAEEVAAYTAVFQLGVEQGAFERGVQLVVEALLQSPHFLYRPEIGEPVEGNPGIFRLTGTEVATRLSYFVWGSMPDDELLDAAEAGALEDAAGIEAQARRMLGSDKAREAIASFHAQWLQLRLLDGVDKDTEVFPNFTPSLAESMQKETRLFAATVVLEGDGRFETLFRSPHTFANAELAALYGVEHPSADPEEFVHVDLDPDQRSGLLTQAGVLTALSHPDQTSPVQRGKWVREEFLCWTPAPPPPDVDDAVPEAEPGQSAQDRFNEMLENPTCKGCHEYMNPLGYAFEHYDGIGSWRTEEGGSPIDAQGWIVGTQDINVDFDGAIELGEILGTSREVQECVATQWFRFGQKRLESEDDDCTVQSLQQAFVESGANILELMVSVTTTDAFRFRKLPDPEADPDAGGE